MTDYQKLMNDYTNNLDLVEKMYTIKCTVMEHGIKKVEMNYYFCSCDPEGNDPICDECKIHCHSGEGHMIGEKYSGKQICQCGIRCHKLELNDQDSSNRHIYNKACNFHELAYISKDYRYFIREKISENVEKAKEIQKICIYCHVFCTENEFEDEKNENFHLNDKEVKFKFENTSEDLLEKFRM